LIISCNLDDPGPPLLDGTGFGLDFITGVGLLVKGIVGLFDFPQFTTFIYIFIFHIRILFIYLKKKGEINFAFYNLS
jgi:hypothetical protein